MLQVHSVRHVRNNAHATLETYAFSIDIWMQVRTEHLFSLVIRQHGYKSQKFGTPKHDVTKTLTEFTTCMVQAMGQVNGRWQLSTTPPPPKKYSKDWSIFTTLEIYFTTYWQYPGCISLSNYVDVGGLGKLPVCHKKCLDFFILWHIHRLYLGQPHAKYNVVPAKVRPFGD